MTKLKGLIISGGLGVGGGGAYIRARENEVRERIPVPHDNYFQSFFSSRHAARVISEFCSHDRAVWFHVGHQGISYHSSLCALRGRGM